jgi:hypothetical protein
MLLVIMARWSKGVAPPDFKRVKKKETEFFVVVGAKHVLEGLINLLDLAGYDLCAPSQINVLMKIQFAPWKKEDLALLNPNYENK